MTPAGTEQTRLGEDVEFLNRAIETIAKAPPGPQDGTHDLLLGGVRVRLEVAGELANTVLPALGARLVEPHGTPDVHLYAYDGGGLRNPPWERSEYIERDQIRGRSDGRIRATFAVPHRALNLYDTRTRRGIFWCADPELLPPWEAGAPLRHLFAWALADFGCELIHSGSAGLDDGSGLLLVGPGGSGKSTTTVTCVAAGMRTVGDDYLLLDSRAEPVVYPLYDIVKLTADSPARAGISDPDVTLIREDGKAHVRLSSAFPHAPIASLRVKAVVQPSLAGRTGAVASVSPGDALRAIAPNTMTQIVGTGDGPVRAVGRMVRSAPAFSLEVGPDRDEIPARLKELLR